MLALVVQSVAAVLRLPAAEFVDVLSRRTFTATNYDGVPLATMASTTRGNVLKKLARGLDASRHPDASFHDPPIGLRIDGGRLGPNQATHDWQRDGRRIACKSSQLRWNGRQWVMQVCKGKLTYGQNERAFDELHIALVTPRAVYVYRHDLQLGVTSSGKSTAVSGHQVQLYGPVHESSWQAALDVILARFDASECERLATITMDAPEMGAALASFPCVVCSLSRLVPSAPAKFCALGGSRTATRVHRPLSCAGLPRLRKPSPALRSPRPPARPEVICCRRSRGRWTRGGTRKRRLRTRWATSG